MPDDNDDEKYEWRDILAMIIATFWIVGPYVIALAAFCAVVAIVLKLVAH